MADIAELGFNVNTRGLIGGERALDKFAATGVKTESKTAASARGMSSSFKMLSGAIGSVAAAMVSLNKLVAVTREFDVLNAQLVTATGSAENAAVAFGGIQDFAARTPFDLAQVTSSFTKLVNLGLTPSEKALESYGNTASAMGKDMNQLIEAVADATTNEFERLKEFGIKTKQEGDNVSFTFRGVTTTVKKEAEAIEGFLMDLGENEFAGAMSQRVGTLDGAISNLGDNWNRLFLNVSQAGVGSFIEDEVRVAISALDDMNDFIESGQLAASIDLLGIKFGGLADDVESAVDDIVSLFSAGGDLWSEEINSFLAIAKDSFLNFPENVRAAIQLAGVEIAALVTFAEIYGEAFGKVLGVKFGEIVQQSGAFGQAIGEAINPFSDGDFDLDSELERLSSLSIGMTNEILANAESAAETNTQIRRDAILQVIEERDAAVKSSDEQIEKIIALGEQFDILKKKRSESTKDTLEQFKIVSKESDSASKATSNQVKDFEKLQKSVDDFGGAWSKTGSVIIDAFGDMSDALTNYMDRVEEIGKLEKKVAEARVTFGADNVEAIKMEEKLNSERVSAELAGMKSIASATGSLFDEKTAAAKAFAALNQVLTVAEIALSFQKMAASTAETGVHVANETTKQGANALTAITSAFAAPFPINFAAGAAMIGIMGGLLGSVFGGGGSSVDPTEALQESQGTGTVLGSRDKSASILESQARFEDLQIDQLAELRGIRDSITDLSSGIAQLATSIIGGSGIDNFAGSLEGSDFTSGGVGGFLNDTLGKLDPTGLISGILSAFSSTTRTVIDSGIAFVSQSLGEIIDEGIVQAQAFFTIETKKKKWFGLSKSSSTGDEFQSLDAALNEQIGAIFTNIGDTVIQSAELLGFTTVDVTRSIANDTASIINDLKNQMTGLGGISGDINFKNFEDQIIEMAGFTTETVALSLREALNEFEVDVGKISLEGLSGEEIQKELEAVFSKQADLIAEFIVPSIKEYQQIGEGLFDTLTRVAKEQVIFNSSIEKMGFNLSGLANTIQIDIAQSVIALSGGVDKFNDATNSFFDNFFSESEKLEFMQQSLSSNFESLGLSMVTTREGFKSLVEGIDITTEEGQRLLAALLEINPALSDYIDELERIEQKRTNMTIELLRLQGDAEEALAMERQLELEALDESLRALQLLIFAEEDRIALLKEQESAARESFSMLEKSVELEKSRAKAVLDVASESHKAEISRIETLRDSLNEEKAIRESALSSAESALRKSFSSEINSIQNSANERIQSIQESVSEEIDLIKERADSEQAAIKSSSDAEIDLIELNSKARVQSLNDEKAALDSTASSMRSLVNSINKSLGLDGSTDIVSALAGARRGDFSAALKLDASSLTSLDPSEFGSAEELAVQQAINQNRLKEIGDLAGVQLTETEKQLSAIESQISATLSTSSEQIDAIKFESENQIEQINAISEAEIAEISSSSENQIEAIRTESALQVEELERQLNALLGIDDSVLSVADAVNQFKDAQSALDSLNYDEEIAKLDMLVGSANDVYALHEQAYTDEIERLDKILLDNESLLNAALGIDDSILSVEDAISNLADAIRLIVGGEESPNENQSNQESGFSLFDSENVGRGEMVYIPPQIEPISESFSEKDKDIINEIKSIRNDNLAIQKEIVKNTKTTANILQRFELDGLDTRSID